MSTRRRCAIAITLSVLLVGAGVATYVYGGVLIFVLAGICALGGSGFFGVALLG